MHPLAPLSASAPSLRRLCLFVLGFLRDALTYRRGCLLLHSLDLRAFDCLHPFAGFLKGGGSCLTAVVHIGTVGAGLNVSMLVLDADDLCDLALELDDEDWSSHGGCRANSSGGSLASSDESESEWDVSEW